MNPKPALAALCCGAAQCGAGDYAPGSDSLPRPGVPKGSVTQHTFASKLFPGATRSYRVYVPAQYNGTKPACLMIFQDGGG